MGFLSDIADAIGDVVDGVGDVLKDAGSYVENYIDSVMNGGLDNLVVNLIGIGTGNPWLGSAYNTAENLADGNTTGAIISGVGGYLNYGGDIGGSFGDQGIPTDASGAYQFDDAIGGTDFPTDSMGNYVFDDAVQSTITPFDVASQRIESNGLQSLYDTQGFSGLQDQITSGPEGARSSLSDAYNWAKQAGIAAGDEGSAVSSFMDLYPENKFNFAGGRPNFDINTLGGYQSAHDWLSPSGGGSLDNINTMMSAGNSLAQASLGETAAFAKDQTSALNPTTSDSLDTGYDWNKTSPQNNPFSAGVDAMNAKPAFDMSGAGTDFGAPQGKFGDAFNPAGDTQIGSGMTTMGDPNMQQSTGPSMWDKLKTGWGGQGGKNPMGPLQAGVKLGSGVMSYFDQQRAKGRLEDMYKRGMETADPQAGNRNFASQKWQENINNPETAWNEYQAGAGGQAMQSAAAKYAKAGRRNMLPQLQAQNKMNFMTDYIPKYRTSVNPAQFGAGNGATVSAAYGPALAQLEKDKYAPLSNAFSNVAQAGGLSSLYDYFGS